MHSPPAPDTAAAEARLFELRPRLARFFASRGRSWAADELADDVILRVLQKIRGGLTVDSLEAFTLGVARNVWLEHIRGRADKTEPLAQEFEARQPEPADSSELDCLEQSLGQIPPGARALILRFYGAGVSEAKNKDVRRMLAEELGISMNALLLRASKLRRQLGESIERCLEGGVA